VRVANGGVFNVELVGRVRGRFCGEASEAAEKDVQEDEDVTLTDMMWAAAKAQRVVAADLVLFVRQRCFYDL
jgi:hypothetical protein